MNRVEHALFNGFSIIECALKSYTHIYVLLQKDGQDLEVENTWARLIVFDVEQQSWQLLDDFEELNFVSMSFCESPDKRLLLMDEDGEIVAYLDGENNPIREADVPGGEACFMDTIAAMNDTGNAYAVGSERHIWKRNGEDEWESIHASTHTQDMEGKSGGDVGFHTISGFNECDIYVSGYQADTWRYDGKIWHRVDLPIDHTVNSVLCADNGQVYLAADLGCLIKGRNDHWRIIESDILLEDSLDCLTWFDGYVYFSTSKALLRINQVDEVEAVVEILPIKAFTAGIVKANKFMLVACGVGTVRMFDGRKWYVLADY